MHVQYRVRSSRESCGEELQVGQEGRILRIAFKESLQFVFLCARGQGSKYFGQVQASRQGFRPVSRWWISVARESQRASFEGAVQAVDEARRQCGLQLLYFQCKEFRLQRLRLYQQAHVDKVSSLRLGEYRLFDEGHRVPQKDIIILRTTTRGGWNESI